MKPKVVSYQLVPVGPNATDDPLPALNSITLDITTADGQHLGFKLALPSSQTVTLPLKGEGLVATELKNIVSIESPTNPSDQVSNNKYVFFTHRPPGILVDFTASRDIEGKLHISLDDMVEVYRGIYVNKLYINNFDGRILKLKTFGEAKAHTVPVSRANKRKIGELARSQH